ncbi:hypothetical protein QTP86_015680 [Hemibagrus guttatus]|nr:hypothetical protein QTP86_015680 [Hemibagrus guttatus]
MDKRKDLSEFDKDQIVMPRPLDQSISKTAALVGCSRSAVGPWRPTSQLAGLKGSAANILVPDTTAHLHGSMWSPCLDGSGLFWQQRGNQQYMYNVMLNQCMNLTVLNIAITYS